MFRPPIRVSVIFPAEAEIEISAAGFEVRETRASRANERYVYIGTETAAEAASPAPEMPEFSGGWMLHVTPDTVTVRTDPIGLHPLYYMRTTNGFLLSDLAGSFLDHPNFTAEVDEVGFWQALSYESCLRHRTMFRRISQLGAAEEIRLSKDGISAPRRYQTYTGLEHHEIGMTEALSQATKLFDAAMETDFAPDRHYLLPLSGGADSRLMAVLLRRHVSAENIHAVTYAHSRVSWEYRIAADICRRLGLAAPSLHRLTAQSYLDGAKWLPHATAGAIPFSNIHMLDHLTRLPAGQPPSTIAGTAFSDALCGYVASGRPKDDFGTWTSSTLHSRIAYIDETVGIDPAILDENNADISALAEEWRGSDITSFNEFNYIVERHVKFHHVLARTWMMHAPIANPFVGKELRSFFFGLPPALRHQKALEIALVDHLAPELGPVASSSSLVTDGRKSTRFQKAAIKSWNGLNTVIRATVGPRFELLNPYQTEELGRVLNSSFRTQLAAANRYLGEMKLLSDDQQAFFRRPVRRMGNIGTLQYFAINAAETISRATSGRSILSGD